MFFLKNLGLTRQSLNNQIDYWSAISHNQANPQLSLEDKIHGESGC